MMDRIAPLTRLGLLLALLLLPAPRVSAQFEDTTTVVTVEVPVNVFRAGAPLRGLTKDDFEVFDGREKQEITGFEVVDLARYGAAPGQEKISRITASGRRHFLLLFDLSLSDPESVTRARRRVRPLIQRLHPADLVAVAAYSESGGMRMVLNFTPNREQAEMAIDTLGLAQPAAAISDPLSLMIGDLGAQRGVSETGAPGLLDDPVLQQLRDLQALTGRVARDQQKNQVVALTQSMGELATAMRGLEGRKHVVFLSEGFGNSLLTGTESVERQAEIQQAINLGEYWKVDAAERFGDSEAGGALARMAEEFRRAGCTIEAIDIGGLEAGPDADTSTGRDEGLFRMAHETGGELYQNYNQADEAIAALLERTSVTYLLAFAPSELKLDGKYRKLRVRLTKDLKGVRLVHRPGYYPPKPFAEQSVLERKLVTASEVVGGEAGGAFLTNALAAPFPSPLDGAYVPVLVEVDGESLLAGHEGGTLVTEIYAYAFDDRGEVRDFFVRRLGLDTDAAGELLRSGGLKYYGHLELDSGSYVVRTLVRNATTGDASLAVVPLRVPDRTSGEPELVPPLFPEPANKWVFGRESEEEQLAGAKYPFMMGDQPFVPAARPVVSTSSHVILLPGFSLGDGSLSLAAQLFTADGKPVDGAEIRLLERPETGVPAFDRLIAEFSLGSAMAGDYLLVVTVTDRASGKESTASVELVVEG